MAGVARVGFPDVWDRFRGRICGLSGRLAASYVLVTFAVVTLTEILALGFRPEPGTVKIVTKSQAGGATILPARSPVEFVNPVRTWDTLRHWTLARPLVTASDLVLLAILPVGVLFGLLMSRRLVHRVQQLEAAVLGVADGDYTITLPTSGRDEIGRLETNFTAMARQLNSATAAERAQAGSDARAAERSRIARELHDSISQHLFAVRMIAGGMRRADPDDGQAAAIEHIAEEAVRDMHVLLLELRPVSLDSAGLAPALERLCASYRDRLGLSVVAELDTVTVSEPAAHSLLRITQEACANAVRHGNAESLTVMLTGADGDIQLAIRDDGIGFDPSGAHAGSGLVHIRERATELGGTATIHSRIGTGTLVAVTLPAPCRSA